MAKKLATSEHQIEKLLKILEEKNENIIRMETKTQNLNEKLMFYQDKNAKVVQELQVTQYNVYSQNTFKQMYFLQESKNINTEINEQLKDAKEKLIKIKANAKSLEVIIYSIPRTSTFFIPKALVTS